MGEEKRRRLDFLLLAGMIGLWVWWLFLRGVGFHTLRGYFELLWDNKFPIGWIGVLILLAIVCYRKRRWLVGTTLLVATMLLSYWAYGPDFPKRPPFKTPKILWQSLYRDIPVMLFITYEASDPSPPTLFNAFRLRLYKGQQIYLSAQEWRLMEEQAKKILVMLSQKAGEDIRLFSKCLSIAANFVQMNNPQETMPPLPLCAEKRYEYVTGQLCWVFAFFKPQRINFKTSELLGLSGLTTNIDWVAVRLRFPQKAWLTYLATEPSETFRSLLSTLLVITGYAGILVGLRYVFKRWL